jgi:CRP-like cAMP-binding protein
LNNLPNPDVVQVLSNVSYFSELDSSALGLISAATLKRSYGACETIFLEGDRCIGLYIVLQGWAQAVKVSGAGREHVIRFVGPGDVFNEVGVLTGGVNVVTVQSLEPVKLLIVQRETLLALVDECPSLASVLIENLANRVLYAMNLVVDLSLRSVESRLASFLLENAKGNIISRKKWTTQAFIAARIGTVPVVVNRAFRSFVEDDLIELERDKIQILNLREMQRIASLTDKVS